MWVLEEDIDLTNGGSSESQQNSGALQGLFEKRRPLCFALLCVALHCVALP
jgi:hypothetical protein